MQVDSMNNFPKECVGCPFQTGDFVLTKDYVDNFICQCDCLSNCSYFDNAREFVEEQCDDSN